MRRLVLLLALPLAACGAAQQPASGKFKGDQKEVAKVVEDLASAGRRHDAAKICSDILARQLVAELKSAGGDCVTEMKDAIQDATDFDLRVDAVNVAGDTATARVRQGEKGQAATFAFVKENGAWKASALGG
jgi:hypothetical protein